MVEFVSSLFFVTFMYGIFSAGFILYSKPKEYQSWLLLLIMLAIAVTNFGNSLRISSISYEQAMFWSDVAFIGWHFFYALVIMWCVEFFRSNIKWIINIVCLSLIFYSIWTFFTKSREIIDVNIVSGPYGYINKGYDFLKLMDFSINTPVVLFMRFFIVFSDFYMIYKLIRYKDTEYRLSIVVVIVAIFGAYALGITFEMFAKMYTGSMFPSLSSITLILIPISISIVLIRQGKLRNVMDVLKSYYAVESIENQVWQRVEVYIAILAFLSFWLKSIFMSHFTAVAFYTMLTSLLISVLMRLTRISPSNKNYKRTILMILFAMEMVIALNSNYDKAFASMWIYPLIFVPIFLLFSQRIVNVAVSIVMLSCLTAVIKIGETWRIFDRSEVIEISILVFVFIVQIFYANSFYKRRTMFNQRLVEIQENLSDISTSFIDVNRSNIEEKIGDMLDKLRNFIGADRVYISMFKTSQTGLSSYLESLGEDVASCEKITDVFTREKMTELTEIHNMDSEFSLVRIRDAAKLPIEAGFLKSYCALAGVQSLFFTTINTEGAPVGLLGASYVHSQTGLLKEEEDILIFGANTVSEAISLLRSQAKVNNMAFNSELTGLPNAFAFKEIVANYVSSHPGKNFALALLDLDSFVEVNDTVGHDGGDSLIKDVANDIKRYLEKDHVLAHLSGDEFAILLTDINNKYEIGVRLTDILNAIRMPKHVQNKEFYITASVGVSIMGMDAKNREELMNNAELAQQFAKRSGKDRYVICDDNMLLENNYRQKLKTQFQSAIERGELVVEYQPILSTKYSNLVGMEALLRWESPQFGRLMPDVFLPIMDEVGADKAVSDYVIAEVCKQIGIWRKKEVGTKVSMNFSLKQLMRGNVADVIYRETQKNDISPSDLEVEFAERISDQVDNNVLTELRNMGVSISMDAFGRENSSMSLLADMALDAIKLDKVFIENACATKRDEAIVKSIINVGHRLGLEVTASGIENYEQFEFFRNSECDNMQGFSLYYPLNARDAEDLLEFDKHRHLGDSGLVM